MIRINKKKKKKGHRETNADPVTVNYPEIVSAAGTGAARGWAGGYFG